MFVMSRRSSLSAFDRVMPVAAASPLSPYGGKWMAVVGLLVVTAIWGSGFVFMKNALEQLTPLYFLAIRFGLAAVLLAAFAFRQWRWIDRRFLRDTLLSGLLLALGYSLQTIGLERTSVTNSAFITGMQVVFVPLCSLIVQRRIASRALWTGLIAFIGLSIFSLDSRLQVASGDLWVLGGALGYACHFVVIDRQTERYPSLLFSTGQVFFAAVAILLFALVLEPRPTAASFSQEVWFALVYSALLSTALAYFIQTAAQKVLSASQTSLLAMAEAPFGAFFGWLLLDERFGLRQWVGAAILFACMFFSVWDKQGAKRQAEVAAEGLGDSYHT